VTFALSAGYAPLIPFYGNFLTAFDTPFFPLGAYARFSVIPLKFPWGNIGMELEPFWNYLEGSKNGFDAFSNITGGHINLLYQRQLFNAAMAINLHLGGGITWLLDYHYNNAIGDSESLTAWYGSAAFGASLRWFPAKHFFLEAGLEYNHVFTMNDNPHQGYLRPMIGVGVSLEAALSE
jgi:hypothetical protein